MSKMPARTGKPDAYRLFVMFHDGLMDTAQIAEKTGFSEALIANTMAANATKRREFLREGWFAHGG